MSNEIPTSAAAVSAGPAAGLAVARVVLKPKKVLPFIGRHPWVFDSAIQYIDGEFKEGDVVDLCGDQGKFVARGIINSKSKLQVRLYTWNVAEPLDDLFWRRRLERAIAFRQETHTGSNTQARRLVFSESDGLSGLIVDQYGDYLVAQVNSNAIARNWESILSCLVELTQARGVIARTDKSIAKEEALDLQFGVVWGQTPEGPILIEESGVRFGVDLLGGQKTGFYLDQAENRKAAARYLKNRRVLDLFCYTGAFSLIASRTGSAKEVVGIDGSERAITLARANAELNGVTNVRFEQLDGFDALDGFRSRGEKFDAVILDPPKFARGRRQVDEALRAYHRINRVAVDLLEPGGILVTCSCSGGVAREDFMLMLSGVAQKSGRDIQILEHRGAAADHPTSVTCLETDYLKCFICRVL